MIDATIDTQTAGTTVKPPVQKRGFGRRRSIDLRDHAFALQHHHSLALAASTVRQRYHATAPALDQGETPQCVAYSTTQWLFAGPIQNQEWETPQKLYDDCQAVDEWHGTPHDGSSVRAAFKVLKAHGAVSAYKWAYDVPTAANFVLTTAPVVFGTLWTDQMMDPDSQGFLWVGAGNLADAGGHAYLVYGVNLDIPCPDGTKGAFRMQNSWGRFWGYVGHAWIPFSQAEILLREDGECACGIETFPRPFMQYAPAVP